MVFNKWSFNEVMIFIELCDVAITESYSDVYTGISIYV